MSGVKNFEELFIWQEARDLSILMYKSFSGLHDFGFKDQIQRASVSIMNNIAEGFERESKAELKRFLVIAKGSCGEVRSMLILSGELGYLSKELVNSITDRTRTLSAGIANFIRHLKT